MGFDKTQRITGAIAIIFLAYFVAHTIHRYNESKKTPSPVPESEPFKGKLVSPEDYPKLPGGPDLKRPMLMGQLLQSRWAHQVDANPSMLFLDISITNRGESSRLKDWRLFVEVGGKDVSCPLYPFPPQGLNLYEDGKQIARFTPDMSIAERGLHDPVEHGAVREGWIIFLVQKGDLIEVLKGDSKIRLEYHDYLENNYTLNFKLTKPETPLSPQYIPGSKNPEAQ
jgi:hypothetical protein